ncbi:MAG TPA: glycosyl hydrolase 53 family protein [Rhodothermales bacterium]|nr:glycosyl hydrolase 53 family protein [Rhodothermales bacterium]
MNEAGSSLSLSVSVTKCCVAALFLMLCSSTALAQAPREFIRGVDVSHLDRLEEHGAVFRDAGVAGDALVILQNHGVNWVRLRLWHSPAEGYNGLERTVRLAERVKAAGMGFLLDIHYSDTWADPSKQFKPAAWQNASCNQLLPSARPECLRKEFEALRDSVRAYTGYVLARFQAAGASPDMVQVGNEITSGMLWNTGRVGGNYNGQWSQFAELLKAGIEAVRAAGDSIEVMIHIDRGGRYFDSEWFFDNLTAQGVDFDGIGLSFYPWWHGRLTAVDSTLKGLARRYQKDIVIVEAAYPWTLQWGDNENNIVGLEEHLHPGYPATVQGQKSFLEDLFAIIRDTPDDRGRGLVYWEPAHIPVPGFGSPWENLALFNFQGNLLASADAFAPASDVAAHDEEAAASTKVSAFPNPFGTSTRIQYVTDKTLLVELRVYDALGRLVHGPLAATGSHEFVLATGDLAPGLYLYRITAEAGPAAVGLLIRR